MEGSIGLESEVWRIERVEGFGAAAVDWTKSATVTGVRLDPDGSSAARGEVIPEPTICNAIAAVQTASLNMMILPRLPP